MITGQKYRGADKPIENCLISILNSDIDVDKFDYVLRDAFMSGSELVSIDIERLISAYTIHEKKLVFSGKALSTISNLIYGRNALYTWVYNHHITVYTDFLFRRLIKYLIEKNPEERDNLFSYKAISDNLADDYDLMTFVRKHKKDDEYIFGLYNQLFNRAFYKSLWKNPFEFEAVIKETTNQDEIIKYIGEYRDQQNGLELLEQKILENNKDLKKDDFYIAVADFKPFTPVVSKTIYILLNDKFKRFQDIFQESIYLKPYREIPYIFARNEHIKDLLIKRINEGVLL